MWSYTILIFLIVSCHCIINAFVIDGNAPPVEEKIRELVRTKKEAPSDRTDLFKRNAASPTKDATEISPSLIYNKVNLLKDALLNCCKDCSKSCSDSKHKCRYHIRSSSSSSSDKDSNSSHSYSCSCSDSSSSSLKSSDSSSSISKKYKYILRHSCSSTSSSSSDDSNSNCRCGIPVYRLRLKKKYLCKRRACKKTP